MRVSQLTPELSPFHRLRNRGAGGFRIHLLSATHQLPGHLTARGRRGNGHAAHGGLGLNQGFCIDASFGQRQLPAGGEVGSGWGSSWTGAEKE